MPVHSRQIFTTAALMTVIVIGIGVGVYYFDPGHAGTTISHSSSTGSSSSIYSSSSSSSSSLSTLYTYSGCNNAIFLNGTEYCSLNVTNETILGNPGYSIFKNGSSIYFNGLTFTLLCPSGYYGCLDTMQNRTTLTLFIGVIDLRLTYPNDTTVYLWNFVPLGPENLTMLSNTTNPGAGLFFEFGQHSYQTFLLVQRTS